MSLVNFNVGFGAKIQQKAGNVQQKSDSGSSVFTPAPSTETAGSVASAAPASTSSSGSFSGVC